jgi:hypothetical protein
MFLLLGRRIDEIAMTGAVGPPSITEHKSAKMRDDTVVKLVGCDWHKQFKITVAVSTLNETWRAVRFGRIDSRPKLPVTQQICDPMLDCSGRRDRRPRCERASTYLNPQCQLLVYPITT